MLTCHSTVCLALPVYLSFSNIPSWWRWSVCLPDLPLHSPSLNHFVQRTWLWSKQSMKSKAGTMDHILKTVIRQGGLPTVTPPLPLPPCTGHSHQTVAEPAYASLNQPKAPKILLEWCFRVRCTGWRKMGGGWESLVEPATKVTLFVHTHTRAQRRRCGRIWTVVSPGLSCPRQQPSH